MPRVTLEAIPLTENSYFPNPNEAFGLTLASSALKLTVCTMVFRLCSETIWLRVARKHRQPSIQLLIDIRRLPRRQTV